MTGKLSMTGKFPAVVKALLHAIIDKGERGIGNA
jgi:hypothetical protein